MRSRAQVQTQRLQNTGIPVYQVYSTFSFLPAAALTPFPRELPVCTPHPVPATPVPASKNPRASLTFRPPPFRPGTQPPPRPFPRPLGQGSTCRPRKAPLPPRPPSAPPPALGLTREYGWPRGPRFPPAGSPVSDSALARSAEEASAWPRQASPPSRRGRAETAQHHLPASLPGLMPEWRRSPRPAASEPSPKGNKGSGYQSRSPRPALARSPPELQQSPSRCLAPPAWLTHRSPHASCWRGNPPPGPTGAAWTSSRGRL